MLAHRRVWKYVSVEVHGLRIITALRIFRFPRYELH